MGCKSPPFVPPAAPFDVEIHEMELCGVLKAQDDEDAHKAKKDVAEALAEGARLEDEEEEEEEKETNTQESAAEERRADSHCTAAADEKSAMTQ